MNYHQDLLTAKIAARYAGAGYLLLTITAFIYATQIDGRMLMLLDGMASVSNVKTSPTLFRLGIFFELVMSLASAMLALSLYLTLRPTHKPLAFVSAGFRLFDPILSVFVIFTKFAIIELSLNIGVSAAFTPEQQGGLVLLFHHIHFYNIYIVLTFLGVGASLACYLLYRSRFVPRWLAIWGMIVYCQMSLGSLLVIVFPQWGHWMMMSFIPGALLELLLGGWLLLKGIDTKYWEQNIA